MARFKLPTEKQAEATKHYLSSIRRSMMRLDEPDFPRQECSNYNMRSGFPNSRPLKVYSHQIVSCGDLRRLPQSRDECLPLGHPDHEEVIAAVGERLDIHSSRYHVQIIQSPVCVDIFAAGY